MAGSGSKTELGFLRYDPAFVNLMKLRKMFEEDKPLAKDEILKNIDEIIQLERDREDTCDKITEQPSAALKKIIDDTINADWKEFTKQGKVGSFSAAMMSGNREVQFLKSMISMNKSKRILEVGLFTGCGALAMAEALPADGVVVTCELNSFVAQLAKGFLGNSEHGKKVTIKEGPANETCRALGDEGQQFDFIFMDANKDGYIEIYEIIKEKKLLAPNGTIAVDNTLFHGRAYTDEDSAIAKFNAHVLADQTVHRVLLPNRDGLMLIRRKSDVEERE